MGWIAQQLVGGSRDPWWDPDGRSRRRSAPRRFLELAIVAVVLASLALGLGVGTARAATTVNLDQWATLDLAWQNGNLNGNNSRYPEGGVVPFRVAFEGLAAGSHEIHINYDFTAGGHKAYDFLATWNVTNAGGAICSASGGGISSMCPSLPSPSTFEFPADPFVADGLSVTTAQVYSGTPRRLTLWGGTITSISGPVHSGSVDGNSTADFMVRFTSTGSAVLLAWGGHLAQSAFWNLAAGGERDGAGQVSGAPWHMRTLQLDGSGNKNQDRSIQPSAIVGELPPFALAVPTPGPGPGATAAPPAPGATPAPPAAAVPTTPGGPRITPPPTATLPAEPPPAREPDSAAVGGFLAAGALMVAWMAGHRRRVLRRRDPLTRRAP
ncbi:MAG TPA: hypothetical protein VFV53_10945 [Candidatus Limnocylindrales bacterium]|nr:hypothetical protein [Candidatus Limnocylindrales bacterium]